MGIGILVPHWEASRSHQTLLKKCLHFPNLIPRIPVMTESILSAHWQYRWSQWVVLSYHGVTTGFDMLSSLNRVRFNFCKSYQQTIPACGYLQDCNLSSGASCGQPVRPATPPPLLQCDRGSHGFGQALSGSNSLHQIGACLDLSIIGHVQMVNSSLTSCDIWGQW